MLMQLSPEHEALRATAKRFIAEQINHEVMLQILCKFMGTFPAGR